MNRASPLPEPSLGESPTAPANGSEPVETRDGKNGVAGLHLALVLPNLVGYGAERVVLTLIAGLLKRGHRVDLLLTESGHRQHPVPTGARLFVPAGSDGASPWEVQEITEGEQPSSPPLSPFLRPYQRNGSPLRALIRLARALGPGSWYLMAKYLLNRTRLERVQAVARYMEEERPSCVLPGLPDAKITCLLARFLLRHPPPIVPMIHNSMNSRRQRDQERYARLFPSATRIVTVSQGVADSVRDRLPHLADRIATIYNGVELDAIGARASEPPPHPWLEDDGPPVILAVGRLHRQKDFPILLNAFAQVVRARACRLLILGDGQERGPLEALARQLGIDQQVDLPGWAENPWSAMARASVFALSSRHEGLPTALIEALACGCPVVSTDCRHGPFEILEGGRYGALVPVGDDEQLAQAILRTLEEEETNPERAASERRARIRRAQMFRPERSVEQYLALLADVSANNHTRRGN